jgi:hypothetical protein
MGPVARVTGSSVICWTVADTVEKVLKSCADSNPVVIRVGSLQGFSGGIAGHRAMASIYTHSNSTKRVAGLASCLASSGFTQGMGFPD